MDNFVFPVNILLFIFSLHRRWLIILNENNNFYANPHSIQRHQQTFVLTSNIWKSKLAVFPFSFCLQFFVLSTISWLTVRERVLPATLKWQTYQSTLYNFMPKLSFFVLAMREFLDLFWINGEKKMRHKNLYLNEEHLVCSISTLLLSFLCWYNASAVSKMQCRLIGGFIEGWKLMIIG